MPAPTYFTIRSMKIIQFLHSKIFALQSYWDDNSLESIINHEMGNTEKVQSVIIISTIVVNGFWSQIFSLLSLSELVACCLEDLLSEVTMFPLLCKNVKIPHWEYNSFVWDWDRLSSPDIKMIKLSTVITASNRFLSYKLKDVRIHLLYRKKIIFHS